MSDECTRPGSNAEAPAPAGMYLPAKQHENLLFVSSMDAATSGRELPRGRVGKGVSLEEAREHAERCALNIVATVIRQTGSLDAVETIVHVRGMICCANGFTEHPKVLDGCSRKLIELLGERGRHARSVLGVASLPNGTTVEVEAVIALKPDYHQCR